MNRKNLGILAFVAIVVIAGVLMGGKLNQSGQDQLAAGKGSGAGGGGGGSTVYCSDSDGGVNPYTKGTTYTYTVNRKGNQSVVSTQTDSCSGSTSVTEYSCSGSSIATTPSTCGTGMSCVDGACISSSGGTGDTTPPIATVITAEGTVFGCGSGTGAVCINNTYPMASSIDSGGTASVTFYNNGTPFVDDFQNTTDGVNPVYSDEYFRGVNWPIGSYPYTITAQATDNAGNVSAMSAPVNVTIQIVQICDGTTASQYCQVSGGGKGY